MSLVTQAVIAYIRTKFRLLSSISKRKAAASAFELFCTPQSRVKRALPHTFKQAEKLEFSFEGNTVKGYRWNHSAPKKVLILHGFESSVINFEQYVAPLVSKGYEVLAFDAPAHGRSTGTMINVLTYKNLVLHVYKEYGPVRAFIAHSFGGLGLSLALEEIDHGPEFKVVLIAPATETTTAINNFFRHLHLDNGVRAEFDALITHTAGKPAAWYSIARAAAHMKAQVLFLQDKDDNLTPLKDVQPIIEKNYPNFRFVITEGLGHSRIYRDSEVEKQIVDFL